MGSLQGQKPHLLGIWWRIVYWYGFVAQFTVLPFHQEFADSEAFHLGDRIVTSLRNNLIFYLILSVSGSSFSFTALQVEWSSYKVCRQQSAACPARDEANLLAGGGGWWPGSAPHHWRAGPAEYHWVLHCCFKCLWTHCGYANLAVRGEATAVPCYLLDRPELGSIC